MKSSWMALPAALVLLLGGCTTVAAPKPAATTPDQGSDQFTPLIGETMAPPIAVPSTDGRIHLAYELLLTNVISQDVTLESVQVSAASTPLLTIAGDDLLDWMSVLGTGRGTRVLHEGQRGIVWLDVVVDSAGDVPTELTHRIELSLDEEMPPMITSSMSYDLATTSVSTESPVVIGPPLAGPGWLDGNGCCGVTPHRAAVNPINGALHVPERFAVDYVQLDSADRLFEGDVTDIASYAFVGAPILAVADGPVVGIVSDLPQQTPGANPTGLALDEFGGNHVVQDIGGGRYAFYAHLASNNPLGLVVGQQLTKGETLGHLGNSGNSDMPHLHFHIMDSPSPLASNGLPFLIDSFEFESEIVSQENLDAAMTGSAASLDTSAAGPRSKQGPLTLAVMGYPKP